MLGDGRTDKANKKCTAVMSAVKKGTCCHAKLAACINEYIVISFYIVIEPIFIVLHWRVKIADFCRKKPINHISKSVLQ